MSQQAKFGRRASAGRQSVVQEDLSFGSVEPVAMSTPAPVRERPNSPLPTVMQWCKWLKIDPLLPADAALIAIADEAANTRMPPSWRYHGGMFINERSGAESADHPLLPSYLARVQNQRAQLELTPSNITTDSFSEETGSSDHMATTTAAAPAAQAELEHSHLLQSFVAAAATDAPTADTELHHHHHQTVLTKATTDEDRLRMDQERQALATEREHFLKEMSEQRRKIADELASLSVFRDQIRVEESDSKRRVADTRQSDTAAEQARLQSIVAAERQAMLRSADEARARLDQERQALAIERDNFVKDAAEQRRKIADELASLSLLRDQVRIEEAESKRRITELEGARATAEHTRLHSLVAAADAERQAVLRSADEERVRMDQERQARVAEREYFLKDIGEQRRKIADELSSLSILRDQVRVEESQAKRRVADMQSSASVQLSEAARQMQLAREAVRQAEKQRAEIQQAMADIEKDREEFAAETERMRELGDLLQQRSMEVADARESATEERRLAESIRDECANQRRQLAEERDRLEDERKRLQLQQKAHSEERLAMSKDIRELTTQQDAAAKAICEAKKLQTQLQTLQSQRYSNSFSPFEPSRRATYAELSGATTGTASASATSIGGVSASRSAPTTSRGGSNSNEYAYATDMQPDAGPRRTFINMEKIRRELQRWQSERSDSERYIRSQSEYLDTIVSGVSVRVLKPTVVDGSQLSADTQAQLHRRSRQQQQQQQQQQQPRSPSASYGSFPTVLGMSATTANSDFATTTTTTAATAFTPSTFFARSRVSESTTASSNAAANTPESPYAGRSVQFADISTSTPIRGGGGLSFGMMQSPAAAGTATAATVSLDVSEPSSLPSSLDLQVSQPSINSTT
eukprot:TRINITY_DN3604_c0_g1_i1.p1 TRINITY_DN3604_c0_g1~~TRINITY_DN3604_c0_g1_i1.p1  ORF type:complete len:876 (-),score=277.01 TRINITY_DN3604_c0_g1_i1:15-2642(-)